MAFENEMNEYKQLPSYPTEKDPYGSSEYWTIDRVLRWLEVNDFKPAIEVFKARHICGKVFLNIDMSYLMAFQNELVLSYTEKRKLAHAIKALRSTEDRYQINNQRSNTTTTNTNNGRISNGPRYAIPSSDSIIPLIPERKSSNNEQVLGWMKSFSIPTRVIPTNANNNTNNQGRTASSRSPFTNTNTNNTPSSRYPMSPSSPRVVENDGTWKFVRRKPNPNNNNAITTSSTSNTLNPPYIDHPIQHQSIHVTKDSDTFHSLQVTGMHDPRLIKNSIIRKLGLEGSSERYLFYHENGKNSEVALTDNELSHICQISDHSSTNRILVKPAPDHALEHYRSYSKDGTNCYDFAVQGGYPRRYVGQYAEPRPTGSNCSSDYELNVRSRYETNGMISPINGNSQFTISSPQEGMEDSRDDSGYFDKMSRKPSMDADAAVWPTHPPLTVDTNNRTPLWAVTPQSQRSSTSSTETQQKQQQQQQQYVYQQQQKQQNGLWPVQSTSDLSLGSSLGETIVNSNGLWPVHQDMPQLQPTTPTPMPSLWAVPPKQPQKQEETITTSQSLWAIPPSNRSSATLVDSSFESKATPTTITSSVSLWAVSPSNVPAAPTPTPSLWAIAPQQPQQPPQETDASSPEAQQFGSENLNLHPSISGKTYSTPQPKQQRGVQFSPMIEQDHNGNDDASSTASAPTLEEGIEGISLTDPSPKLSHHHSALHIDTTAHAIDDSRSPIPSPSTTIVDSSDEENWAERPSVERLYKDIDKYLPGHDLDKEIIVEPVQTPAVTPSNPTMVAALPPGRRLGGHKKSIRNVAHEAHRNWRNAVNVIRANNLIRRRSTKMWHRNVEQVKPGMKADIQTSDTKPKSTKLQWIRGELIGKGSFGRVYHAFHVEAGEWIAVKQVDLPTTKADYANSQLRENKDALFREISLLEDLDNEYIVQYLGYDVDESEGHINIFLEYVPGGSIASCLSKTGKFAVPLVRFLTQQILMGLAYLHNRNILHRDIKAGNILLDENGICKITDFGLSKLSGQDKAYDPHSNNSVMRGTVFWMAPEVVKGTNYNAKVDIWSLGCTVIEMLTGDHPWLELNMLAALYSLGKYQAPSIPEDIPEDAKDFLNKCFTINPEDRPTAEQLLSHPFVQSDPTFEFKKYMKKAKIERTASKRLQPIPVEN